MKKNLFFHLLLSFFFMSAFFASIISANSPTMLVIGDSISTGALTNPDLSMSWNSLYRQLIIPILLNRRNERTDVTSSQLPQRLFFTPEEMQVNTWRKKAQQRLFQAVDQEDHSWSFYVARYLSILPQNLYIAAQAGTRAETMLTQLQRYIHYQSLSVKSTPETKSDLSDNLSIVWPDYIFIFFTGNDLCEPKMNSLNDHYFSNFYLAYQKTIDSLATQTIANPQKTKLYILPMMNITQHLTNSQLLEREIDFLNSSTNCQNVRTLTTPVPFFLSTKWFDLNTYCTDFFHAATLSEPYKSQRIRHYKQLQNRFRELQYQAFQYAQKTLPPHLFETHWLGGIENMVFEPQDVANDCFHLSIKGQQKLANEIIQVMQGEH